MIRIQNLEKSFPTTPKTEIVTGVSLEIPSGSSIAIIGPSGSGKSTLLNILSGLDSDYKGEIIFNKTSLKKLDEKEITHFRAKNISYIFQNFQLIDNLTVEENVDLIIDMNQLERNFSTKDILEIVGLSHKINEYVYHLSGGERQRTAIARAFVGKTDFLLADEPTGALDSTNKQIIMDLIQKLHEDTKNTIVMITHDPDVAKSADKVYKLTDKNLVEISSDTL